MKYIELSNSMKIPTIAYGTPIININTESNLKMLKSYIGKIVKSNYSDIKKFKGLKKILNEMEIKNEVSLIDTSRAYGASEYIIGKKLKKSDRSKYMIITKLANMDQYKGNVEKALKYSLDQLQTNYVDVYLMHWPVTETFLNSWKQMEECYEKGLCKAIGVCNCNIHHLEEIKKIAKIKPMINQIECHPLFTQKELREYCKKENIVVMAYTSTARMDDRLKNTCIIDLAKKYNKTMAQIILKWHMQVGNIPIFNTNSIKHYKENMNVEDFELSDDEVKQINLVNINSRLRYDPDNCNFKRL